MKLSCYSKTDGNTLNIREERLLSFIFKSTASLLRFFVFTIYKLALLSLGLSNNVVWYPFSDADSGTAPVQLLYAPR